MTIVYRSYVIGHKFITISKCGLLNNMILGGDDKTIVYRSYVIGHKFINPIDECGV